LEFQHSKERGVRDEFSRWRRGVCGEGFLGGVWGRVGSEERDFLKNQNEKRGGFCDEW